MAKCGKFNGVLKETNIDFNFQLVKFYFKVAYNGFGLGEGGDFQHKC